MKKQESYDLKSIYEKLISKEIPQSFVNDVLARFRVEEQTEEEKKYAATATVEKIFYTNVGKSA